LSFAEEFPDGPNWNYNLAPNADGLDPAAPDQHIELCPGERQQPLFQQFPDFVSLLLHCLNLLGFLEIVKAKENTRESFSLSAYITPYHPVPDFEYE
jgi:hypothetical protein